MKFTKASELVIRIAILKHSPDDLKRSRENSLPAIIQCNPPQPSPSSVYLPLGNIAPKSINLHHETTKDQY